MAEEIRVSRNTIIGHGGKHGQGGTYLAGQALPPDVAARVMPGVIASAQGKPPTIGTPTPAPPAPQEQAPAAATPPTPPGVPVVKTPKA